MRSQIYLHLMAMAFLSMDKGRAFEPPNKDLEKNSHFWIYKARRRLQQTLQRSLPNTNVAKNIIVFIGDGMDLSTITAGRIQSGQNKGFSGEEHETAMEKFPHAGLMNGQTPDSAGTATAILTGVKTRSKVLGLNGHAEEKNCSSAAGNDVKTILEYFADLGRSTGIISTAYVTHATPASSYAHTPSRGWTADSDMTEEAKENGCKDIALQLLEKGRKINVILGGGRVFMRPRGYKDEEYGEPPRTSKRGRNDGRNLIEEWKNLEPSNNAKYVWNKTEFDSIKPYKVDNLLGLFEPANMQFDHERDNDTAGEPSIAEMTAKAIAILRRNKKGYFLLIESGKIDRAHHETKANVALSEFAALDEAVKVANGMTSERDTLIIVTADHGHMFSVGGDSVRGNPITGLAEDNTKPATASDGHSFPSIAYGNGREWLGYGKRKDITGNMTMDMAFRFPSAIPLPSETHSATDVTVMARGPMSHLFSGVYEQNYIGYAMMYASCSGPDKRHCRMKQDLQSWKCDQPADEYSQKKKRITAKFGGKRPNSNPWWCSTRQQQRWSTRAPPTHKTYAVTQSKVRRKTIEVDNVRSVAPPSQFMRNVEDTTARPKKTKQVGNVREENAAKSNAIESALTTRKVATTQKSETVKVTKKPRPATSKPTDPSPTANTTQKSETVKVIKKQRPVTSKPRGPLPKRKTTQKYETVKVTRKPRPVTSKRTDPSPTRKVAATQKTKTVKVTKKPRPVTSQPTKKTTQKSEAVTKKTYHTRLPDGSVTTRLRARTTVRPTVSTSESSNLTRKKRPITRKQQASGTTSPGSKNRQKPSISNQKSTRPARQHRPTSNPARWRPVSRPTYPRNSNRKPTIKPTTPSDPRLGHSRYKTEASTTTKPSAFRSRNRPNSGPVKPWKRRTSNSPKQNIPNHQRRQNNRQATPKYSKFKNRPKPTRIAQRNRPTMSTRHSIAKRDIAAKSYFATESMAQKPFITEDLWREKHFERLKREIAKFINLQNVKDYDVGYSINIRPCLVRDSKQVDDVDFNSCGKEYVGLQFTTEISELKADQLTSVCEELMLEDAEFSKKPILIDGNGAILALLMASTVTFAIVSIALLVVLSKKNATLSAIVDQKMKIKRFTNSDVHPSPEDTDFRYFPERASPSPSTE